MKDGARVREFVRNEDSEPFNVRNEHGMPIRTLENRQTWQRKSNEAADHILALHPAVQKRLTLFAVRCPTRGCLLGRVYKLLLPNDRGVRYVYIGVTWTGQCRTGIINWAWDGYRGAKEWIVAGCQHGTGNVDIGLLYGMVEAVDHWRPDEKRPENWLSFYDEPVQKGFARRTIVLPDMLWKSWSD